MAVNENGHAMYLLLSSDSELLPTDGTGRLVERLDKPIPANEAEMLIDHYERIHND